MKRAFITVLLISILSSMTQPVSAQTVIPLYEGKPAFAKVYDSSTEVVKKEEIVRISNVSLPSMTAYFPQKPNGTAILIYPGGGYGILAWNHEGTMMAEWLNSMGITAFVVKYRLPNNAYMTDKEWVPLRDALQSIRIVREHAKEWKLDKHKIGIMGFSAGGHLAATVSNHYDDYDNGSFAKSGKPDFSVLFYPVIFSGPKGHSGSSNNLLGTTPSAEQLAYFNNAIQVDKHTPPAVLFHASDDKVVPIENSQAYFAALQKLKPATELFTYPDGGHGFGMLERNKGAYLRWKTDFVNWLGKMGLQ